MINELVYVASYLLPVPFMALFYLKTSKLDFIKKYGVLLLFVPILAQLYFTEIGYQFPLIVAYAAFVLFGAYLLSEHGWPYPKALSIAFLLAYFGSFLWELPTLVYTIVMRGGVDGAFPLHVIYIFPMLFVYEKVKTNRSVWTLFSVSSLTFLFSAFVLFGLAAVGVDIWQIKFNTVANQALTQTVWMVNRIVVVLSLFYIYVNSTLRVKKKYGSV